MNVTSIYFNAIREGSDEWTVEVYDSGEVTISGESGSWAQFISSDDIDYLDRWVTTLPSWFPEVVLDEIEYALSIAETLDREEQK